MYLVNTWLFQLMASPAWKSPAAFMHMHSCPSIEKGHQGGVDKAPLI